MLAHPAGTVTRKAERDLIGREAELNPAHGRGQSILNIMPPRHVQCHREAHVLRAYGEARFQRRFLYVFRTHISIVLDAVENGLKRDKRRHAAQQRIIAAKSDGAARLHPLQDLELGVQNGLF